jgi:hypothetical protein
MLNHWKDPTNHRKKEYHELFDIRNFILRSVQRCIYLMAGVMDVESIFAPALFLLIIYGNFDTAPNIVYINFLRLHL